MYGSMAMGEEGGKDRLYKQTPLRQLQEKDKLISLTSSIHIYFKQHTKLIIFCTYLSYHTHTHTQTFTNPTF